MPRAKKSVKSAVAPDETPIAPAPVTPTAASTATEVKTKVVSKTAMAVAVAFLGFAAIAAGMLTLPQSGPSGSNCFDSDYATKNDGGSSVLRYSFINQATKGTAYGIQTNSTQFVSSTDKCWDSKKLLEFFCDVKNNKVTWNSYNCAAGTSCVDGACLSAGKPDLFVTDISMSPSVNDPIKKDISVTVKNIGNAVAPPFVINLYQKNADGSNQILSWAELSEMNPGVTTVYTTNKLLPTTITLASEVDPDNKIIESNETNNYFEVNFSGAVVLDEVSATTPKTCSDAVKDPDAYAMFGFCKNKGYKAVCFNKFSLAYQVCTDENGKGCITDSINAAKNIRCLVGSGVVID